MHCQWHFPKTDPFAVNCGFSEQMITFVSSRGAIFCPEIDVILGSLVCYCLCMSCVCCYVFYLFYPQGPGMQLTELAATKVLECERIFLFTPVI